jgi:hypothetical protein
VLYDVAMEFIQSLKATAQQIIELSSQFGERVHTWNQEKFAPAGGYTDRAGFVVYDDVELFTDVFATEDGAESLLRARLAWAPKDEADQALFTIVTLDFNAVPEKTKAIIADSDNLTQQILVSLLNDPSTTPKHIHVSLESGKNPEGKSVGKRYEYSAEDLQKTTEDDQAEFLSTLGQAYNKILSKT